MARAKKGAAALPALAELPTPQQVLNLPLTVVAPAGQRGRAPLRSELESRDGGVRQSVDSSFFGPI